MEIRARVSKLGKQIFEVAAAIETNGNESALLRQCMEQHPVVQHLRAAGQVDAAARMAKSMLAAPANFEMTKLDRAVLLYLERGPDVLERIFKSCNVDQRRDADALTVTRGMLSGFLVQLVKLVRLGAVDCEGEALSGQWFLTEEGKALAQEVRA